jgi:acetate kinase
VAFLAEVKPTLQIAVRDSSLPCVLTLNGGSSSIRFAVFAAGKSLQPLLAAKIDRIGQKYASLIVSNAAEEPKKARPLDAGNHLAAVNSLLNWLEVQPVFTLVRAIGHRVVHGMSHSEPQRITPGLLTQLRRITPYAPEHLPRQIALIEAFSKRHPKLPQVACFDTAFHRTLPQVAKLLPIPRRFAARGTERYGFHGLSYAYLMDELGSVDPASAISRVILAHLGNGASLAAVRNGNSVDTSMGFTPTSGLMMGTRTGDLDPGVLYYLSRAERMTAARVQRMVNHESGLLGVSGTSADLRDLLARESADARAAQAVALFCYQAKKWIGAYAAVLGGVDTLVFAGGVGENSPAIRARICDGLGFLGIEIDHKRNAKNAPLISPQRGRVNVRVMHTDEELMIARSVSSLLKFHVNRP